MPACLRMVLAGYGVERTEAEIYTCCQTDADGTLPSATAQCARNLGFDAVALRLSGIDMLREHLETAHAVPIIYLHLGPLLGLNVIHAVIIEAINIQDRYIHVIDPAFPPTGRREWTLDLFEQGWRLARYQVILISPKS